ncbi:MAG: ABC transporter ATP-binding protein [Gammaproteobacteria bacterium]|nr:ABC transporter ATP-binding protein [Gammaproteobacteria bacterium]
MLEVLGLKKSYPSGGVYQVVIDNLSLTIKHGEVVALLGASGSGKTTLLNLLSGIDSPDSGTVKIDNTDLHSLNETNRTLLRRQKLGFVFQFFNLIPTLTVAENIALPLQLLSRPATEIAQVTSSLLNKVGLAGVEGRYPETLSGGEQQRIAIARAVAHQPLLLLADEPTGNLDEETGLKIIQLLNTLAREQNISMLLVTHSQQVADSADRILTLQQGKLN